MNTSPSLLCDTNVWLDHYLGRRPGHGAAKEMLQAAIESDCPLLVPFVSLKDFVHLMQIELKRASASDGSPASERDAAAIKEVAWAALENLLELASIVGGDASDVWLARKQRALHDDFEDDLVIAAALRSKADFLVTSDERLLRHSPVAALSPASMTAYLRMFEPPFNA